MLSVIGLSYPAVSSFSDSKIAFCGVYSIRYMCQTGVRRWLSIDLGNERKRMRLAQLARISTSERA